MSEHTNEQNKAQAKPAPAQESKPNRQINPRWFLLADPDRFFNELLMEQNEQK